MSISFEIVVAMDQERGIGLNGTLPWNLPGDMKHFKELTSRTQDPSKSNTVIMGRKTWDSLPVKFRPLPGRINVVLTRSEELLLAEGVIKASGLDDALTRLSAPGQRDRLERVFVIGGEQVFRAALEHPACRKIHLTVISRKFDSDTFFPEFQKRFAKEASRSGPHRDGDTEYYFAEYQQI